MSHKQCGCNNSGNNRFCPKFACGNPCCREIVADTGRTLNTGALQFDPVALNNLGTLGVTVAEQSQRIALYNAFFGACIAKYVTAATKLRTSCCCSSKSKNDHRGDHSCGRRCDRESSDRESFSREKDKEKEKEKDECCPCCAAAIVALGEIITGLCQYGFNATVTLGVTVTTPPGPADLQTILNNLLATADAAFNFVFSNLNC